MLEKAMPLVVQLVVTTMRQLQDHSNYLFGLLVHCYLTWAAVLVQVLPC